MIDLDPKCALWWMVNSGRTSSAAPPVITDIGVTLLTSSNTTTDAASFSTASVSPNASELILLWVSTSHASANTPTVSGLGLTWALVATETSGTRRGSVYRTMSASAITPGAITMDYGAASQGTCDWAVVAFSNVDTGGTNGSGAIVQSGTYTSASATTTPITLAAFAHAQNVHFAGSWAAMTAGQTCSASGFAEIWEVARVASPNSQSAGYWLVNEVTSTPTWTGAASAALGIACEIKVAGS